MKRGQATHDFSAQMDRWEQQIVAYEFGISEATLRKAVKSRKQHKRQKDWQ